MKLTTPQAELQRGLTTVGRAVALRSTLPQATHIYIATDGGRLKLAATNLEIAITCWLSAEVADEGSITIPARLLTEFVTSLPDAEIELTVAPRSRQVQIHCARNEATISGMDADDYPPIPAITDGDTVRLEPAALRTAVEHVVFAAATDDSRPVLTGVHMKIEDSSLTFAAADGFRLAVYTLYIAETLSDALEIIVPAKSLAGVEPSPRRGDRPRGHARQHGTQPRHIPPQ